MLKVPKADWYQKVSTSLVTRSLPFSNTERALGMRQGSANKSTLRMLKWQIMSAAQVQLGHVLTKVFILKRTIFLLKVLKISHSLFRERMNSNSLLFLDCVQHHSGSRTMFQVNSLLFKRLCQNKWVIFRYDLRKENCLRKQFSTPSCLSFLFHKMLN